MAHHNPYFHLFTQQNFLYAHIYMHIRSCCKPKEGNSTYLQRERILNGGVGQFKERASPALIWLNALENPNKISGPCLKSSEVPVQQETLNMKAKENQWSYSRMIQPVLEHTHPMVPTLLQDSQDCHGSQPMNLIQHTDFSRT